MHTTDPSRNYHDPQVVMFMMFSVHRQMCLRSQILLPLFLAACVVGLTPAYSQSKSRESVKFNRDIRPILAAKCFACHGPDEETREADLRLDIRADAVDAGALVPGDAASSELVSRIQSHDDDRMPPRESGEGLSEKQQKLLIQWINQGAKYEKHWAFVPPSQPVPPPLKTFPAKLRSWPRNPIDHFVLAKLVQQSATPNRTADKYSLIRRVYLDLIGLPPTPDEADAFVNSRDPKAFEKVVDRLLESDRYGEKWARHWLDLARYADTNGYEKDRSRSIWPYRDWVIKAINNDLPYDQFSIEQLAGDMLPDATNSQIVATGFHRNTMLNEEGGIDPLEYRYYAMVDRVATTGTVWLGLTTGCAQCHSHKYDPISHVDYFRMMALLNNADEPDIQVFDPGIAEQRKQLEQQIAEQEKQLKNAFVAKIAKQQKSSKPSTILRDALEKWIDDRKKTAAKWHPLRAVSLKTNLPKLTVEEDLSIFASGDFTKRDVYQLEFELDSSQPISAIRLEVLPDSRLPAGGPGNAYYEGRKGDFFLSEFNAVVDGTKVDFSTASTSYGKISIGSGTADGKNVFDQEGSTGWSTSGQEGQRNQLVLRLVKPIVGQRLAVEMIFERHFVASLGRFRISATSHPQAVASQLPASVETAITQSPDTSPAQRQMLERHFLLTTPVLITEQQQIETLRKKMPRLAQTMVMRERAADNLRKTYRHHRGEYLSPREEVHGELLSLFPGFAQGVEPNRLNFAKWLVSDKNPLADRVAVNRYWQVFFGRGIVETTGDFGTQGAPPTHPELLDWLAIYFRENGWSRKKLHKLIVTSATYRQSSIANATDYQMDPLNERLARGPRFRVDAEMVRDIMLAASGKLSNKMYGPGVYPPQPKSVTALAYGNTAWPESKGADRYRRSLYTFSKRTAPFAAYLTFNSPTGENCVARRNRSNTPLQALTILNDALFVELATAAAEHVLENKSASDEELATQLFRDFLTRPPEPAELTAILEYKQKQMKRLAAGKLNAAKIAGPAASPQLAAWTLVARSLMSLDEVITKP